jgi:hypothetical protein
MRNIAPGFQNPTLGRADKTVPGNVRTREPASRTERKPQHMLKEAEEDAAVSDDNGGLMRMVLRDLLETFQGTRDPLVRTFPIRYYKGGAYAAVGCVYLWKTLFRFLTCQALKNAHIALTKPNIEDYRSGIICHQYPGCLGCTPQVAAVQGAKRNGFKASGKLLCAYYTPLSERTVEMAHFPAFDIPNRFTMTDDDEARANHGDVTQIILPKNSRFHAERTPTSEGISACWIKCFTGPS